MYTRDFGVTNGVKTYHFVSNSSQFIQIELITLCCKLLII